MVLKNEKNPKSNLEKYLIQKAAEKSYLDSLEAHQTKLKCIEIQREIDEHLKIQGLMKKLKKTIKNQDRKFIRNTLPSRPKVNPLLFKQKMLENIRKSLHEELEQLPAKHKEPIIIHQKLSFELNPILSLNNSPKKVISRQFFMAQ